MKKTKENSRPSQRQGVVPNVYPKKIAFTLSSRYWVGLAHKKCLTRLGGRLCPGGQDVSGTVIIGCVLRVF